ncbi:MAG TPA: TRAP transporter small permease subunit [Burkholderiaceae bacterium]|nr:TRAP transporter small permease subunit [Burkholderiaceae bacterium]
MRHVWRAVDRAIENIVNAGGWLVLPVALLLFLQWPLREFVGRYSREANDLGQWLFALYVTIALTAATRRGAHLATDALSHRYPESVRRVLLNAVRAFALLPWTIFIVWSGAGTAARAVAALERFPDTFNPGYFVVKLTMILLALLLCAQTLVDLFGTERRGN